MTDVSTREVILQILMAVFRDGTLSHIAIREALDRNMQFSPQERAFIKTVAEGTIERRITLDYILDQFASVPVAKMKPQIANILRSALYQMRYMDSVPDRAACDEAVRLTQKMGFYNLKGFVNGVLRSIARNSDAIRFPAESSGAEYLSITYSMPRWIVKRWLEEFGPIVTERMLSAFLKQRPLTVRLREEEEKRKEAMTLLTRQGVTVKRAPYLPCAAVLEGVRNLTDLTAFRNGLIYPQDVSSMLVGIIAAPKAGDKVIDLCAAPGGKSLHVADAMKGFGMVEARDLSEEKVEKIRENIRRTDMINIVAHQMDATVFDAASENSADIVLCDVPCSGLGVIGRKPDIRYRTSLETIEELVLLQRRILHNAANYVRPGGILIYSTCTVGRAENTDNLQYFLSHYPFHAESLDPYLPRELRRLTTKEGYLQLLPGIHETDGFFIARLRRDPA